jgi:hypothetical protein
MMITCNYQVCILGYTSLQAYPNLLSLSHLLSHKQAAVHQREDHHRYGQRYAKVRHP